MRYFKNVWLWIRGFRWLWTRNVTGMTVKQSRAAGLYKLWRDGLTINYLKGYGPLKFMVLVYIPNVGLRTLTGGPVTTYSRWWYERRKTDKFAKLMTRLLNKLDKDHGEEGTPILWGSEECGWEVRYLIVILILMGIGSCTLG